MADESFSAYALPVGITSSNAQSLREPCYVVLEDHFPHGLLALLPMPFQGGKS